MIAIFDIDGCIADDRRRRPLLPTNGERDEDWEAYHNDCFNDAPVNMEVVKRTADQVDIIVFLTARPERYFDQTRRWLEEHFDVSGYDLLMRPNGDGTPSARLKARLFEEAGYEWPDVVAAYDDREDILAEYKAHGVENAKVLNVASAVVPEILRSMATTFEERNAVYGDNYRNVAPMMRALFPDGIPPRLVFTDRWHLFELIVIKLTRFAISGLTHPDSIHDIAVYAAMIEGELNG